MPTSQARDEQVAYELGEATGLSVYVEDLDAAHQFRCAFRDLRQRRRKNHRPRSTLLAHFRQGFKDGRRDV